MILQHGRVVLAEILRLSDLYKTYKNHKRLKVFVDKGRKCVICDREGTLLLKTIAKDGSIHVDLYTDDFVLLTVDHTVPKSVARKLGWVRWQIESLTNKQPMCEPCNSKKGCKEITDKKYRAMVIKNGPPPKQTGDELIRRFINNENVFDKSLTGVI